MKTLDIISCIVFAVFGIICFVCGFWNWFHFISAGMCFAMSFVLYDEIKDMR